MVVLMSLPSCAKFPSVNFQIRRMLTVLPLSRCTTSNSYPSIVLAFVGFITRTSIVALT